MKTFTVKQHYVILLIICCLLTIFSLRYFPLRNIPFFTFSSYTEEENHLPVAIEIVGEVEKPGIYSFKHKVTLGEVIERAGGFKSNVVLAQKYFSIEVSSGTKVTIGSNPSSFAMEMMEAEKRLLYFIPINVNTASLDELMVVTGIGEKTARAIIGYRMEHGDFSRLDELEEVPGIGHYKFKRMKDYLTI